MSNTITVLENRISEKESELKELKLALKVLKEIQEDKSRGIPSNGKAISLVQDDNGVVDLSSLVPENQNVKKKDTLHDAVKSCLPMVGEQEFTVAMIERLLIVKGMAKESVSLKNRIAMSIKKLVEEEKLVIKTHEGKGSDPHKYKVKK